MLLARARVHGGHEHEVGGERHAAVGAADRDDVVLQGLAQHLQGLLAELWQLVEEEDAPVRQANLPRAGLTSSPYEPGLRDRMVRRAEWPLVDQGHIAGQQP